MRKPAVMYGDFVGFWMMLICSIFIIRPAFNQKLKEDEPNLGKAYTICLVYVWNAFFSFASWWRGSITLSFLAGVGFITMITLQNLFEFPSLDGMAIVPQFLWLLAVFSCNVGVEFAYRAKLGLSALVSVLFAALYSPTLLPDQVKYAVIPSLIASTAVYMGFHYWLSVGNSEDIAMHGARLALALYFGFHIISELETMVHDPNYAPDGGFAIVRATSIAAAGLVALGTFHNEKDLNRKLQTQVEEQEDKLRMVGLALQASETAIAMVAASTHQVIWTNPAFEKLCSSSDALHHEIVSALGLSESNAEKLSQSFDIEASRDVEICVRETILQVDISPFLSGSKTSPARFVVVLKDITEKRARERLEKAAEQEVLRIQTIQQSMETLTHELRTPLQGIMGITSILLQDESLPKDGKESLGLIQASSSLLLVLINNLLDIRKLNANMMEEFPLVEISPAVPIKDAADFCRPLAAISGVNIAIVPGDADTATVRSNDLRLQQVIINLISNAIKYSPSGSTIQIASSIKSWSEVEEMMNSALACGQRSGPGKGKDGMKFLSVSVSDFGAGISPGQKRKLFGKWSMLRGEEKRGEGPNSVGQPGSGLGLNLCVNFLRLMDGNIWVTNNQGVPGSTFSFCLPIASLKSTEAPRESAEQNPSTMLNEKQERKTSLGFKYRVLLVDDVLINRKVFLRMLSRIGVTEAVAVDSAAKALDALATDEYDLVISDIQMPDMNGMELSEAIRSSKSLRKKPVVVGLTADTSEHVERGCHASGMQDVIHKPITLDEMSIYFETVVSRLLQPASS